MNENENIVKQIKINQVLMIVMISLLVVFMGVTAVVGFGIYSYAAQFKPIVAEIQKIDFEALNHTLTEISSIDYTGIAEMIDEFSASASEVDFSKIGDLINSINVEEITKAMDGLSKASDLLQAVSEKIAPILYLFK